MNRSTKRAKQYSTWYKTCFLVAGMVEIFRTISDCEIGKITVMACNKRVNKISERLMTITNKVEGKK